MPPAGVVDIEEALERAGNDPALLAEIVDLFLEDCPKMLDTIRGSIETGCARDAERAAHRLKGSLGCLAAAPVSRRALELERAAGEGDLAAAARLLSVLESEITGLVGELRAWTELAS